MTISHGSIPVILAAMSVGETILLALFLSLIVTFAFSLIRNIFSSESSKEDIDSLKLLSELNIEPEEEEKYAEYDYNEDEEYKIEEELNIQPDMDEIEDLINYKANPRIIAHKDPLMIRKEIEKTRDYIKELNYAIKRVKVRIGVLKGILAQLKSKKASAKSQIKIMKLGLKEIDLIERNDIITRIFNRFSHRSKKK
ncbi:MAG TPA: hypothetical protein DHV12_01675 [Thermotogae bacterium]|nr:hypothetical protein [Thermotogota bacterium]